MGILYTRYNYYADIAIEGLLLTDPETKDYIETIGSHIEHCNPHVIPITLNLGSVELISSVGLMVVIQSKKMMNNEKSDLVLYNLSKSVYNLIFIMDKLGNIFHVYKTKEDTLKGLGLESCCV